MLGSQGTILCNGLRYDSTVLRGSHGNAELRQVQHATAQLYTTTACLIKISLLCLYRRLFTTRRFRLASLNVMIACVRRAFGCGVATVFICNPPQHFWNARSDGSCFPYGKALISILSLESGLDTIILILPIRMIFGLQMSRGKQISLSLIFLIGGLWVFLPVV